MKEPFLKCSKECTVNGDCECSVPTCNDGTFSAVLGGTVLLWNEKVSTTSHSFAFIPEKTGLIDVEVDCQDPVRHVEETIPVTGEEAEKISVTGFTSQKSGDINTISLDYVNDYGEDVIFIFTLSKEGDAKNKRFTALALKGTATATFNCSDMNLIGSSSVSWKAFRSSDRENPGAWSTPGDMESATC